jgi:type VI secretion system protein ImpM
MSSQGIQNELGYFGKLPTLGDFVHQVLPQDFANGWHEWLQQCMAQAREALADDFLTYYLNCPVWKFLMAPGVCGAQAVVGLTIPSVDKVGRYFNFTLATVLPPEADPCAYVLGNRDGLTTLEELALDILEMDYPKEEIELKVRELSLQFNMTSNARQDIESEPGFVRISRDQPLPFADQASNLLTHLLTQNLGDFSIWWYGQEGQIQSQMVVCSGMPTADIYLRLLTLEEPPQADVPAEEKEMDYIDKIIAGEV